MTKHHTALVACRARRRRSRPPATVARRSADAPSQRPRRRRRGPPPPPARQEPLRARRRCSSRRSTPTSATSSAAALKLEYHLGDMLSIGVDRRRLDVDQHRPRRQDRRRRSTTPTTPMTARAEPGRVPRPPELDAVPRRRVRQPHAVVRQARRVLARRTSRSTSTSRPASRSRSSRANCPTSGAAATRTRAVVDRWPGRRHDPAGQQPEQRPAAQRRQPRRPLPRRRHPRVPERLPRARPDGPRLRVLRQPVGRRLQRRPVRR